MLLKTLKVEKTNRKASTPESSLPDVEFPFRTGASVRGMVPMVSSLPCGLYPAKISKARGLPIAQPAAAVAARQSSF